MQATVNESLQVEAPQAGLPPIPSDLPVLGYIRAAFYVFMAIKLIAIIFVRKRKLKVSERIQRKFIFAHGFEMIKNFSNEEFELMNITLQNTLKNATRYLSHHPAKPPNKLTKTVSFMEESNVYYDPPALKPSYNSEICEKTIESEPEPGGDLNLKLNDMETSPLLTDTEEPAAPA
jgi:hypothetical protein